jgi:chromosome segregation ATPase
MADGGDSEGEDTRSMFRNSSMDDLRFEVKRLQQRYDVLERDKKILEEERVIASTARQDQAVIERLREELKLKSAAVLKGVESASALGQKHRVVLRHLWLEKRALREMKAELGRGMAAVLNSPETLAALGALQAGLEGVQREKQALAAALQASRGRGREVTRLLPLAHESVKRQKRDIGDLKCVVASELNSCNILFTDIRAEIGSRIARSGEAAVQTEKALRTLQLDHEQLSKAHAAREAECAASAGAVSALEQQLGAARAQGAQGEQAREGDIRALAAEKADLQREIERRDVEKAELREDNEILVQKLEKSIDQLRRLAEIHESVQTELMASLAREEELKNDLENNGSSKNEISSRLKRIQDKVNRMEEEHSCQVRGLQREAEGGRAALASLRGEGEVERQAAAGEMRAAAAACKEEIAAWEARYSALEQREDEKVVNDRNTKIKLAEQDGTITSLRASLAELRLREEEDGRQRAQGAEALARAEAGLQEAAAAKAALEGDLKLLQQAMQSDTSSEEKDKQIAEGAAERARLLIVIQKECQERTELLIHISELKDHIRDNSVVGGQGGGSTAYAQPSSGGGLSQDRINSGLVGSAGDAVPRLADAINYSRAVADTDPGGGSASGADGEAWAQRLKGGGQGGGRGRKSTRGHHR